MAILALLPVCQSFGGVSRQDQSAQALTRQEFMTAMQRIREHRPEPLDSAALDAYVIHDYLVAARLQRDLTLEAGADLDSRIDSFLQAHRGQPVARTLRHEWLASLAQRRRWDWFLPRSVDITEPPLLCARLSARLAVGATQGLATAALARWSLPQTPPSECAAVFAWLRLQGLLTPALAQSRVRAALAADNPHLAREFAGEVAAQSAAPLLQWAQLLEAPKEALSTLAENPGRSVEAAALFAGFNKLTYGNAAVASRLLPLLLARPDMTAALQGRLQRATALGAAYARAPAALAAFDGLPAETIDGPVQEWRVRAALWAGNYERVRVWTEQMPASLAAQPRWRYWHARAVAATSGADAAAALFAAIADTRDYYGYLAADRLHQSYRLNIRPSPDDAAIQAGLAAQPGLIRAHALFDCRMTDDAGVEWLAVLGTAQPPIKIQAAHLAAHWGWYAQAIAGLAQAGEWDDLALRYPRPYSAALAAAVKLTQLPDDWLLALMRQESLFRVDAVSRADARGLMQMQPATAAAVARRWHLPPPRPDELFDPAIAVPLGAAYLRELLDHHAGQLALALAAYNAGPAALARWLPVGPLEADIWIENIPYGETRAYVQHILEHIVAFAAIRGAEPPRLTGLLPRIER